MVPCRVSLAALLVVVCVVTTIKADTEWTLPSQTTSSDLVILTDTRPEIIQRTIKALERSSLELFSKLSEQHSPTGGDFIASPISIWSLLLLISEGASESSRQKLLTTLGILDDKDILREANQIVEHILNVNTSSVELSTSQFLLPKQQMPVSDEFKDIMGEYYKTDLYPVYYYYQNTKLSVLSTLDFKGQWKFAFNKNNTVEGVSFLGEDGFDVAEVAMMTQVLPLAYLVIDDFNISFVELPYGNDNRFSMVLMLPTEGNTVRQAVKFLKSIGVARVLSLLDHSLKSAENNPVRIYLPRFSVSSGFKANRILQNMGFQDLFTPGNLENIHPSMAISNLLQTGTITVNEEGELELDDEADTAHVEFKFNRPFAYMIVDRETNTMLYCGQVMKGISTPYQ